MHGDNWSLSAGQTLNKVSSCCVQGYVTYHLQGDKEIRGPGYFWKILESSFPSNVKESVKGLRLTKDAKGVVFDLPSDLSSVIEVSSRC